MTQRTLRTHCHKRWPALLAAFLFTITIQAEESDSVGRRHDILSVGVSANMSYLIPKGDHNKAVLHSFGTSYVDARLMWKARQGQESAYDLALNRPELEAGLMFSNFSHIHIKDQNTPYESGAGDIIAAYLGLRYEFVQHRKWGAGVEVQNGLAYATRPFNDRNNADNWLIGSRLSVYIAAAPFIRYSINDQWALALSADFKHFSNGTVSRPNLGANTVGPSLLVRYTPESRRESYVQTAGNTADDAERQLALTRDAFEKGLYMEVSAGIGLNTLRDRFSTYHSSENPVHATPTVMLSGMYRYHLMHASGLEVDYNYAKYASHIGFYDQMNGHDGYDYSRHVVGMGFRHEMFFRHVSAHMGAGYYLYRHMGYTASTQEGRSYQTIGLRYSLPCTDDRLFIGYNVKAHNFSKADCMQFHIGWRLRR
ncbi:MAG: acyloxyacyl hydrolase [Prevotella sp.]|nr:acyloxyacyl hydrolase [Prevotella sp.]